MSCRRTAITVLTLALLLTLSPLAPGANELVILDHDHRAEAMSVMSVRVRIHHAGARDVQACRSLEAAGDDCLALTFRWDEPARDDHRSRVETVELLGGGTALPAGTTLERTVPIPTPRRPRRATLHLSLVTRSAAGLDWSDAALDVQIDPPPADIRRRIRVTRGLLALYAVTTVGLAWIAWRRSGRAPR